MKRREVGVDDVYRMVLSTRVDAYRDYQTGVTIDLRYEVGFYFSVYV